MMTPKLIKIRDDKAKEDAHNIAMPVIRSMYPSKSRGQMAREFEQVWSLGFNACYEQLAPLIEALKNLKADVNDFETCLFVDYKIVSTQFIRIKRDIDEALKKIEGE